MAHSYTSLDTLTYPINPDAAYFCPFEPYFDLLLVGLYKLDDAATQTVVGGVALFNTQNKKLEERASKTDISGVLDLKWYK